MAENQEVPQEPKKPDMVTIAALRLDKIPNREQRNKNFTPLGTFNFDGNVVQTFAERENGSMLFRMPDDSGFIISTSLAGNQLYKYWQKIKAGEAEPPADLDQNDGTPLY